MKSLFTSLFLGIIFLITSCNSGFKIVENPVFISFNSTSVSITKVEINDTATVLHIDANYTPNYWIKISSETYLKADGVKYMIKTGDGIELDKEFWLPESGNASFILTFDPLPLKTKSFDFIESDCDECYKIYGVSLNNESEFPKFPDGLPDEYKVEALDGEVPDPIFKVGNSVININVLGYTPSVNMELLLIENRLLTNYVEYTLKLDSLGTTSLSFEQYGTSSFMLISNNNINNFFFGEIWIAPGDTTDIYIDLQETCRRNYERAVLKIENEYSKPLIYTNGIYSELNRLYNTDGLRMQSFLFDFYNGEFVNYDATADEYSEFIESRYFQKKENILNVENCSHMIKDLMLLELETQYFEAIQNSHRILTHCYRKKNNDWDFSKKINYNFANLKQEHTEKIKDIIDFNNPKYLMIFDSEYLINLIEGETKCDYFIDKDDQFINEVIVGMSYMYKAELNTLTDNDKDNLRGFNNSFFSIACNTMQETVQRQLSEIEGKVCIIETPNVSHDKIFDEIISKYKGKVIVVDFWNTWCSPCRQSIKKNEPFKSSELNNDNIVWIYIANETSPLLSYKKFIADVEGEHYRINNSQWEYIANKLKIDGIPSYVLVDADGKYELRNDFRDHSSLVSTLKEEIQKCEIK